MSDASRVIIGSEIDDTKKVELQRAGSLVYVPVGLTDASGGLVNPVNGLVIPTWDYMSLTISPATTETYTFKLGGSGGATVATLTIVYTDSGRTTISTVTKS